MGIKYFTDEQVRMLRDNPYVKNVTQKGITYTDEFKAHFVQSYESGKLPNQIFMEAGFDITILGNDRVRSSSSRWKQQSKRLDGFKDTRKEHSGRPRMKELTKEEIIERQKAQIEYLKQERDFLLELKRLERKTIKKGK
jgi:hypothetical protein